MKPPNTFRELAKKVIREIPKTYEGIYIACATDRAASIKDAERRTHGEGDKFLIRSSNIRIPADFKNSTGENKERMFELMEEVWVDSKAEIGE